MTTIRAAREKLGLSQRAAAKRAGIALATWNRIERDPRRKPHLATLCAIARALRVRVDDLRTI